MGFDPIAMDQKLGSHIPLNALNQAPGEVKICRDHLDSLSQASPEGRHPLDPAFTPQKNPITFLESLLIQIVAEGADPRIKLLIGKLPGPEPVVKADCLPFAEALHGGEQIKECHLGRSWVSVLSVCAKRPCSTSGNC